jgi:hypothetical protein
VLNSPDFSQTRVVDGSEVEEHDEGNFYPRWLDSFVRMLLDPVPRSQVPKLIPQRLTGGGTFALPGRPQSRCRAAWKLQSAQMALLRIRP